MTTLGLTIGWILTILLGLLALIIIWKVFTGDIDINYLISDERGYASLSRFQFLVFTFVVAMSLFYLIVNGNPPGTPAYPKIPPEILALLGISGGSYVLSKGIQTSRDVGVTQVTGKAPSETPVRPGDPDSGPAGTGGTGATGGTGGTGATGGTGGTGGTGAIT